MSKKNKDIIDEKLGIKHICINSALLTAQQRKRIYWVGKLVGDKYKQVMIEQPEDKGIVLKDILESGDTERLKSYCITATYSRACPRDYCEHGQRQLVFLGGIDGKDWARDGKKLSRNYSQGSRVYSSQGKSTTLSASSGGIGGKTGLYEIKDDMVRKLTPIECERLQGFPDNYSEGVSNTQRYKCLGNSFTLPVIKHIIANLI